MRNVIASFLLVGLCSSSAAADQAGSGGAAGEPGTRACSLLPKDLVMKVSGSVNKAVFEIPPREEPAGESGSACHYADITLQIDAFTPAFIDKVAKQENWVPVSGVGDRTYFRDNKNRFAELVGYTGGRTFFIQMGVPWESTAEQMKPNVIALANAIIPKLK